MKTGSLQDASPLCLGGNVFGWTIDRDESFEILDAYIARGGNFIDTADVYSMWADGNQGGESETIIGEWIRRRGNRDEVLLATKGGALRGVTAKAITQAADESLRRLQSDYIDLYYAHIDDPGVPLEETLAALDALVVAGKVRWIAASGYSADRLELALDISRRAGLSRYVAVQPQYNLIERTDYEGELQRLCQGEGVRCIPFYGLARGFLTGKYRPGRAAETKRGALAWNDSFDQRALNVLAALDTVARSHRVSPAAVALAWLAAQPTVLAPIASARTVTQLEELLPMGELTLAADEMTLLTDAGAHAGGAAT